MPPYLCRPAACHGWPTSRRIGRGRLRHESAMAQHEIDERYVWNGSLIWNRSGCRLRPSGNAHSHRRQMHVRTYRMQEAGSRAFRLRASGPSSTFGLLLPRLQFGSVAVRTQCTSTSCSVSRDTKAPRPKRPPPTRDEPRTLRLGIRAVEFGIHSWQSRASATVFVIHSEMRRSDRLSVESHDI